MDAEQKEFGKMDKNERMVKIAEIKKRLEKCRQHEDFPNVFIEGLNCDMEKPVITTLKDNAFKDIDFLLMEIERLNTVINMTS